MAAAASKIDRQRLEKWERWIVDISAEANAMVEMRDHYLRIIHESKGERSPVRKYTAFIKLAYASYLSMSIRRQGDSHEKCKSLVKLIDEITKSGAFTEELRGSSDLADLAVKVLVGAEYADKMIAHYDSKRPSKFPTFAELHSAIGLICKLTKKYSGLLERARD